jgi:hypothetical protein
LCECGQRSRCLPILVGSREAGGPDFIDRSCAIVLGLSKVWNPWLQEARIALTLVWTARLGPDNASLVAMMAWGD